MLRASLLTLLVLASPAIAGDVTTAPNVWGGQQLRDQSGRIIAETTPNLQGGQDVHGLDGRTVLHGEPDVWGGETYHTYDGATGGGFESSSD